MPLKVGFEHLGQNEVVKYLFYYEFNNEEWTKIILNRIHDGKFQMGDNVIEILANLIYEFIGLRNEGSIPLNEKNVKKSIIENS